jgi:hypothetical protein
MLDILAMTVEIEGRSSACKDSDTPMQTRSFVTKASSTTEPGTRHVRSNVWQKLSADLDVPFIDRSRCLSKRKRLTYVVDETEVWNFFICSYRHAIFILSCKGGCSSSSSAKWEETDVAPPDIHMHCLTRSFASSSTTYTRCPQASPCAMKYFCTSSPNAECASGASVSKEHDNGNPPPSTSSREGIPVEVTSVDGDEGGARVPIRTFGCFKVLRLNEDMMVTGRVTLASHRRRQASPLDEEVSWLCTTTSRRYSQVSFNAMAIPSKSSYPLKSSRPSHDDLHLLV